MIAKVPTNASRAQVDKALKNLVKKKVKGFKAEKYFGQLVRGLDGVTDQRSVRNEWS
jgi:hypothetical protein